MNIEKLHSSDLSVELAEILTSTLSLSPSFTWSASTSRVRTVAVEISSISKEVKLLLRRIVVALVMFKLIVSKGIEIENSISGMIAVAASGASGQPLKILPQAAEGILKYKLPACLLAM